MTLCFVRTEISRISFIVNEISLVGETMDWFSAFILGTHVLHTYSILCRTYSLCTHPYKEHLLAHAVAALRLPLHTESIGTFAGGILRNMFHLKKT